jgi:divalent metal cation (Fe/Co/Zn/Cd) transporter
MRRFFAMRVPPIAPATDLAAKTVPAGAAAAAHQLRGHSHSHGGDGDHGHSHGGHGHAHSHGSIEKSISGKFLRQCQIATLAGGATNVFFCITKLWIGSAGGSVALVADGFHALTDILADVISYGAISLSQKQLPRCRFPFGIGRLETSGAVLVAAILFFGGVALLVQSLEQCVLDISHLLTIAAPTGGIAAAVVLSVRNALAAATGSATVGATSSATPSAMSAAGGNGDAAVTTTTTTTGNSISADASNHDHHFHNSAPSMEEAGHNHSHGGDGHHHHSHFEVTAYDETTGKQVILWTMVCIAAASVLTKELLFRWTRRVGLRAGSRVVVANAYHHRADAWSGGVALIGVAGQVVGIPGIDGLAGLAVSLSICKIGYSLFRDAVLEFFDYQNAAEVSAIREQLQEFTLRIDHGKSLVPSHTMSGTTTRDEAGEVSPVSRSPSCESSVASSDDLEAVNRKKILFMNVFLVRHGHKYALHVTLLVYETVQAKQIREATDLLTALARGSLPVQDTFTAILMCSNHTEPREEYLGSDDADEQEDVAEGEEGSGQEKTAAAAGKCAHAHTHGKADSSVKGAAAPMHTAATGNIVNPSLERCIAALEEFHTFTSHIRYNWEERTITAPPSDSCECDRDIASVADMFRCRLIGAPAGSRGNHAEKGSEEGCTHGHPHDAHANHAH